MFSAYTETFDPIVLHVNFSPYQSYFPNVFEVFNVQVQKRNKKILLQNIGFHTM